MSLNELINRIESGEMMDEDFKHPLALAIKQELTDIEENESQRKLFSDARILADHIIEKYISLDKEDKLKMAEVYKNEECFKDIGIPSTKMGVGAKIKKDFSKEKFNLLFYISNYSKLIPLLEDYTEYIERSEDILPRHANIHYYLCRHNKDLKEIKSKGEGTIAYKYSKLNFKKNKRFKAKEKNASYLFESLTFGVSPNLKERVVDVLSLLPQRTKFVTNIIQRIGENLDIKIRDSNLVYQLSTYDKEEKKVKHGSIESKHILSRWNFKEKKKFKSNEANKQKLFESLTYRMPQELKESLQDALSLLPQRTKIAKDIIYRAEKSNKLRIQESSIIYNLQGYNIRNEKVKNRSEESLYTYSERDFKENKPLKGKEKNEKRVFESLTYRLPQELKESLQDALSLLPQRTKIAKNIITLVNEDTLRTIGQASIIYFLSNYDLEGKKVRRWGPDSVAALYRGAFRENKYTGIPSKARGDKQALESLTYGMSQELKENLRDALTLLPQRTEVIKSYIKDGKSGSILSHLTDYKKGAYKPFYEYNFKKNKCFERGEITIERLIDSLTHRVRDKKLIGQFKKYALKEYNRGYKRE